jgi:histidinol-phosphatase (PHP family)
MIKTNYHTHCYYCDGKGEPEDYVKEAIKRNMKALGFSSHSPWPESICGIKREDVPAYVKEIQELKKQFSSDLEIYLGLEIEYFPEFSSAADEYYNTLPLEYRIGSLHSLFDEDEKKWYAIDGPISEFKHLIYLHGDSIDNLVQAYYGHLRDMIEIGQFEILGHMDLIKKHNGRGDFFSEESSLYCNEVLKTLDALVDKGITVEVNSGGIARGYMDTCYPSPWIIKEARKRDLPMQINADAHSPSNVDFWYPQARDVMIRSGYTEQNQLLDGQWVKTAL